MTEQLKDFVDWLVDTLDNTRMAPMPRAELYKKLTLKIAEIEGAEES